MNASDQTRVNRPGPLGHTAPITRRAFLAQGAVATLGLGLAPQISIGQEDHSERTATDMVTPAAQQAIDRGLTYLAARQREDGSFGSGVHTGNVAVCSLAGLAFMSAGSTPGRGKYGANVDRCVRYVLEHTQDGGFITVEGASSHGPMYGHGFATLLLAETYGMTTRADIRKKLKKAVQLIVINQNKDGGWRYQPQRRDADISVTVCQVMALRAARNAGIFVSHETIDRCIDYVKRSQNADGGFMYMVQGGQSLFPRSAAGVVALYSAGIYDGPEITKGLEYLMRHRPRPKVFNRESHFFYGHYYAVQAMWHAGGEHWAQWYPPVRDTLIARQGDNGSWSDTICNEYGTAMACIVLQMPNNYLPIFQR